MTPRTDTPVTPVTPGSGRSTVSAGGREHHHRGKWGCGDGPPGERGLCTDGTIHRVKTWLDSWPVYRQLTGPDPLGRGHAARSKKTDATVSRTATADRVVQSICPYCAVGCGQRVYVKDEQVIQIEGDPDSPISRGRLCPKGSASKSLVTSPSRVTTVKYRRPYGTEWEDLDLDDGDGDDRRPGAGRPGARAGRTPTAGSG